MPNRLPALIRTIAHSDRVADVLSALDDHAGPSLHLQSIWYAPEHGEVNVKDIWFHDSVPRRFIAEHDAALKLYGATRVAQFVLQSRIPVTNSEVRRALNPVGRDQWMFDIRQDHGIRDALVINHKRCVISYWSSRSLKGLERETRMELNASGAIAVQRLYELMPKQKRVVSVDLTPRELAVLEHLARGLRVPAIAAHMELAKPTVKTYLQRAQKKLNAASLTEAAVIAVRRRLI